MEGGNYEMTESSLLFRCFLFLDHSADVHADSDYHQYEPTKKPISRAESKHARPLCKHCLASQASNSARFSSGTGKTCPVMAGSWRTWM